MIKAKPEDFVVEEKATLPLRLSGRYRVYVLRKAHWSTTDLIHHLSRVLSLPLPSFSYGGRKDKHGLTVQFITIQSPTDYSQEGKDFVLEARGFMDRPMGPDLITGNAFSITLRNIQDLGPIERNVEQVQESGFPNFFDDQRFRSYDPARGFFAEKILRRHWNGALQVFLTSVGPEDGKKEQARRETILRNWKNWLACLAQATSPLEKRIFSHLVRHPASFRPALHLLPVDEVSMLFSAYQSHLWNEVLRKIIRLKVESIAEVRGREGSYFFWTRLEGKTLAYLKGLDIPTAAAKVYFSDNITKKCYEEVLAEKNLRPGLFRTKELRRVYYRTFSRRALVFPESLLLRARGDDELHPGRKKLTLTFTLPRGTYGTMLVKRLSLTG